MHRLFAAILIPLALCKFAIADGLIQQLPEDTSWVLYKLEGSKDKTQKGGKLERFEGRLKISSVGTITDNGEKCRWIETEQTYRRSNDPLDEERGRVFKLLIPEKYLGRGATPVDHIYRGWVAGIGKFNNQLPRELGTTEGKPNSRNQLEAETQFYFAGPAVDIRPLEPEVIESKLGKLKCTGVTASIDASSMPSPDNALLQSPTFELRLHDKSPFGVVSYTLKLVEPNGDRYELVATLEDFGKTAQSRLPESR